MDHLEVTDSRSAEKVTPASETASILRTQNADLLKRIKRMAGDLEECREFIEQYSDVVDGDYGEPAPNRAMQLCSMIDETLYGAGAVR